MTKSPVIVITGAGGFLGTELTKHFQDKDWTVRALVRNAQKYQSDGGVEYHEYDLSKPLDKTLIKGSDYLVHAAYIKYDSRHQDALAVNVRAAKQLLDASHKYGLSKNLFMSSMSAHDEAESVYGKQKLAIEELFSSGKDVVFRSGLIVGNGGIVKQMADFMKSKHMVPLVGGGKQPLQTIAIYDLVEVIDKALVTNVSGKFTVATPRVYNYKEFYKALAKNLRVKVLFVPVPLWLLVGVIQVINSLHLPLSISKDNALGLKKLRAVNTGGDLKKLGVKLDSLEEALDKTHL